MLPKGDCHGYDYQQSNGSSLITVVVPREASVAESDINFEYNAEERSIYLGVRDQPPLVCGILYAPVESCKNEVLSDIIKITITKTSNVIWARLISGPSSKGIDAKSLFYYGIHLDTQHQYRDAWTAISKAATLNYFPALLFVAETYMEEQNPYGIPQNVDEGIRIYVEIYNKYHFEDIGLRAAEALRKRQRYTEARAILESCSSTSPEAKLLLGELLSPIYGEINDPQAAVQYFTELVQTRNPKAMRHLAEHLKQGVGIAQDNDRAEQLIHQANEIEGKNEIVVRYIDDWSSVAICASVAAAAVAAAFGIWVIVSKRHH